MNSTNNSEAPKWRKDENGVIYFTVTSDGTTGPEWISRLEKSFLVSDYSKSVLYSKDFKPTSGIITEIAVLPGMLFEDNDRVTKKIHAEADKRKLIKPNAEVACLIREKFTNEDIMAMGLIWIVAMHELSNDYGGDDYFLVVSMYDGVGHWLGGYFGRPVVGWDHKDGFAFAVVSETKI